ncbi:MAG: tRNA (adenosine(37)-N6)-dimethylallyltransferase MiaA [Chloroflexota bacterium]|nr:tRNA (adenosine(37)-N6)-dimethylallyltransferase MiaA [Chloroflexota bacterium]
MTRLISIVGPTATGKSTLAVELARGIGGEIVSADSRQVYRYMDIGTAKPGRKELDAIPHHLIDVVDPDGDFTLATYQELALKAIDDIQRRGKQALLVGGSGLYVRAVTGGLRIPAVPPDTEFRRNLEERAAQEGYQVLHAELRKVDAEAAEKIDPRNVRRVIRALEVCRATGLKFSALRAVAPAFETLTIGLTTSREDLYRRIDARVDRMIERGLVDEVKRLLDRGYSPNLPAMSGLGYKQIIEHLRGDMGLDETIRRIKFETHRFARHQYAWFRPKDETIRWFDIREDPLKPIRSLIAQFSCSGDDDDITGSKS